MPTPLQLHRIVVMNESGWHAGYRALIDEDSQSVPGDIIRGTFKFIEHNYATHVKYYMCVFYNYYGDPMWSYWGTLDMIAENASQFFNHPIAFDI